MGDLCRKLHGRNIRLLAFEARLEKLSD